jgi:hypothetical protein
MNQEKLEKILNILGDSSNQRFRETYFNKNHESLTKEILAYTKELSLDKFPQKVWHWVNDKPNYFLCKTCNINHTNFNKNWLDGYREYCSAKCSATSSTTKEKRKNTCIKIYGVDNVAKNEDIKKKIEDTNYKIYGCKSTFQNENVREKWKKSMIEKWNVEHPSHSSEILEKKENNNFKKWNLKYKLSDNIFREEIKKRNYEKLGVYFTQQSQNYKDNIKNIMIEKLGVENPMFSEKIKEKNKYNREKNILEKYKKELEKDYDVLKFNKSIFDLKHKLCNTTFSISTNFLHDRKRYNLPICSICYPVTEQKSIKEKEIIKWLKELSIPFLEGDRTILEGKELDIYIPSANLAIEFNGLYWHSEIYKDKNYHLEKSLKCQEKGIRLLHIWEDEWVYKQDIVKSIILNKLGLISDKIYARQTEIRVIEDSKLVRQFLDENHIQRYSQSSIKLGLFYQNELVSLMTFGYRHTNSKKEFELIRFCNKINLNIVGAASKLFRHFKSKYELAELISYSDFRLFDGQMYEILGFTKQHLSKPDYFWCKKLERKHRFNFNKRKLIKEGYDSNKTEVEIMHERGYYRIFGCGQYRWVYKNI